MFRTNVRTINVAENRTEIARGRRSSRPVTRTKHRIDRGAALLFVRNGYDGTSMRDLARNLGLRPSSIYGHVKSKQHLLFRVMERLMDEVLERAHEAVRAGGEPQELVRRLVISNICQPGPFETALLQSELRNLRAPDRAAIVRKQKEYRALWLGVLNEGQRRGAFKIKDARLALLGIDGALVHVERWFNPAGRLKRAEVAEIFATWILNSLGFERRAKPRRRG